MGLLWSAAAPAAACQHAEGTGADDATTSASNCVEAANRGQPRPPVEVCKTTRNGVHDTESSPSNRSPHAVPQIREHPTAGCSRFSAVHAHEIRAWRASARLGAFLRVLRLVGRRSVAVTGVRDRCVASGDGAWPLERAVRARLGQPSAGGCRLSGVGFYCRCGGQVSRLPVTGSAVIGGSRWW